MRTTRVLCLTACIAAAVGSHAAAQSYGLTKKGGKLVSDGYDRMLDPKIGGWADVSFHLSAGTVPSAVVEVLDAGVPIDTLWTGTLVGGAPMTATWDGRDGGGAFVDTGAYTIRVHAPGIAPLLLPVNVVRVGVTEIEFQDSPAGDDEWQMVYFKKGSTDGVFYATPAIHEYFSTKEPGEISDLDLDNGQPRSAVPVHTATDQPVMQGTQYELERYNYPVAYVAGSTPRLEATFGASATSAAGTAMDAGYPVAGFDLRAVATFPGGWTDVSDPIAPGGSAVFDAGPLPADVGRYDGAVTWTWQYSPSGSGVWSDIEGSLTTDHRIYTLLSAPKFKTGASGTQYTGPWVEVADHFASWKETLGIATATSSGVLEAFVRGFFGQNGGLSTAIEGVMYDAYPLGGDGGATHYLNFTGWNMDLSALLNSHAKGVYVNCSDNMGAATTMLSMLGVENVRSLRLGPMTLKAIWGIGAPGYTTSLWGSSHGFSYHHIVTRDDGVHVIDTCMQLDEDGNPGATPGVPGWNADRLWAGSGGYNDLSAYNPVTKSLETLPGIN